MSDLEPRVTMLERLHQDNSLTLKAVQTDFHHMTKTLDKIEITLSKFADVFAKVDSIDASLTRCHMRVDHVETRHEKLTEEFARYRIVMVDKEDIKRVEAKLDTHANKLNQMELSAEGGAWRSKIFDRIFVSLLTGIGSGLAVYFFF